MLINSFRARRALSVLWIVLAAALLLIATAAPSSALDPADLSPVAVSPQDALDNRPATAPEDLS